MMPPAGTRLSLMLQRCNARQSTIGVPFVATSMGRDFFGLAPLRTRNASCPALVPRPSESTTDPPNRAAAYNPAAEHIHRHVRRRRQHLRELRHVTSLAVHCRATSSNNKITVPLVSASVAPGSSAIGRVYPESRTRFPPAPATFRQSVPTSRGPRPTRLRSRPRAACPVAGAG